MRVNDYIKVSELWGELKPYLKSETSPCIVCGSSKFTDWARENYLTAKHCNTCGMISVNPHFSDEGLDFLYSNYFKYRQDNELLTEQRDKMYLIDRDWVCNYVKQGNILDIGCSGGFFLSKFSPKQFERNGVEIAEDAAQFARDQFNLNVYNGQVTEISFPTQFDLVMMRGVIEHFNDPISVLKKCSEIIRDNGYLFITATPSGEDSFAFDVYRHKWRLFTPLEHIHFFTVKLLTRVLEPMGFSYVAHHHPYTETPYANPELDFSKIRIDIITINSQTNDEVPLSNPFPGSMITGLWKKTH